jgi:hypothetical protein
VYIDRIIQSNPTFVVNSLNIHRLLITSVMLAAKFFDDQYFNNAYYAKVGGVPCNEMNVLEVEFLFMTNFSLFVDTETYRQYYTELCNHARNTACGCSTQRVPVLFIPLDKFGALSYKFEDEIDIMDSPRDSIAFDDSDREREPDKEREAGDDEKDAMNLSSDSPAITARRIPSASASGVSVSIAPAGDSASISTAAPMAISAHGYAHAGNTTRF